MPARILIVHNSADIYGASRSILRLCGGLDPARFEPLVLLPEDGDLGRLLRANGVQTLIFPRLRVITRPVLKSWRLLPWLLGFLPSALAMASLLRRERIALVHTNTGRDLFGGIGSPDRRNPPSLAHPGLVPGIWPLWPPTRAIFSDFRIRCVVFRNPSQANFRPSAKVGVLHNGFDLAEFPPLSVPERNAARSGWQISAETIVVGVVGRIKFVRKGRSFCFRPLPFSRPKA